MKAFEGAREVAKRNVFINEPHDSDHERAFVEGADWAMDWLLQQAPEWPLSYKNELHIQKECEAWSDWSRIDEEDRETVIAGYEAVAMNQYNETKVLLVAKELEIQRLNNEIQRLTASMRPG